MCWVLLKHQEAEALEDGRKRRNTVSSQQFFYHGMDKVRMLASLHLLSTFSVWARNVRNLGTEELQRTLPPDPAQQHRKIPRARRKGPPNSGATFRASDANETEVIYPPLMKARQARKKWCAIIYFQDCTPKIGHSNTIPSIPSPIRCSSKEHERKLHTSGR
mmetsp:Transcript_58450/g.174102  ORF Transcript_58450/g.174102 Transcript_58450/m.174102 type:complete len:162 (-) Transcript_58450:553-1038(-)